MIDYRAGSWGLHVAFGIQGSLAPRALTIAVPNAVLTFLIATFLIEDTQEFNDDRSKSASLTLAAFTSVMMFILYNRSRTSYSRWWEGGTLIQKARGEWFNAFSSIMAFTSTKPEMQPQVDAYVHLIARLMSLLMCCGLQQVSPNRDRAFEILSLEGIETESMDFLNEAPDKVEIILQWIQRSMVLHMQSGVLPVSPPILSRAFQEVSRGIVNLQNARKIADFPYPYPLAQLSMLLQLVHWVAFPFCVALAVPRPFAVALSFCSIFVLWCIHFNALDLEFPFGTKVNDLPMNEFQQDWNKSLVTLLRRAATRPPAFDYDPQLHMDLSCAMSDASEYYKPVTVSSACNRLTISTISITNDPKKKFDASGVHENRKKSLAQVPGGTRKVPIMDADGAPIRPPAPDSGSGPSILPDSVSAIPPASSPPGSPLGVGSTTAAAAETEVARTPSRLRFSDQQPDPKESTATEADSGPPNQPNAASPAHCVGNIMVKGDGIEHREVAIDLLSQDKGTAHGDLNRT